ncbi:pentapeptide repeat-containing protein, partial [Maritimibacter sp. UBA3975]
MISEVFEWLSISGPVPLLGLAAIILFAVLLLRIPVETSSTADPDTRTPFSRLKHALGAKSVHSFWFTTAILLWATVFMMLLAGLLVTIWAVVAAALPADMASDEGKLDVWEFRFLIAKLGGLTAVLGAVVALPFTVIRLRITNEDNETKKAALFNEKINSALEDLHAMRQITMGDPGARELVWEPDITRRNGAIDRLEALAHENPDDVRRISRTLATYLRERSREHPALDPSEDLSPEAIDAWAGKLEPVRSDMENAAQTLGRLTDVPGASATDLGRVLEKANMQGFRLSGLNFENTDLRFARMEGAILFQARMEAANLFKARMEGANLLGARMEGAILYGARMEGADLSEARMEGADLQGALMEGVNLLGVRMEGANLLGVRMEGAVLLGARMEGADLRGALMRKADLRGALMQGADLSEARMEGASLSGARMDQSTKLTA